MKSASPGETQHNPNQGIFPLHPDSVQGNFRDLFKLTSERVLDLIRTARSQGPEDELFAYLVNRHAQNWENWHVSEGDFSDSEVTRTHYEIGLLYGVDMAQQISTMQRVQSPLKADNPEALNQAVDYLYETYRGLSDSDKAPGWVRQKQREMRFTGSDILTIANATLDDHIRGMMGQEALGKNDSQAVHIGLVDGVIFLNAYERFAAGAEPEAFDEPVEYVPTFDPRKHVTDLSDGGGLLESNELHPFEDLIVHQLDESDELGNVEELSAGTPALGTLNYLLHTGAISGDKRFVQHGPNEFRWAVELKEIKIEDYRLTRSLGLFAVGAAVGDALWIGQQVVMHEMPSPQSIALQSVISVAAMGALFASRRWESKRFFKQHYDVPIVRKLKDQKPPTM
jgi:hypothetical protein